MPHTPLVSIIITAQIPTWFEKALLSALAQDYSRCEILVADYSGDKFITQMLQPYLNQPGHPVRHLEYATDHERIHEDSISAAEGEYIKFMTDAELLAVNCVSTLTAGMESQFDCVVAAAKRTRIDAKGKVMPDIVATAAFLTDDSVVNGLDFLRYQTTLHFNLIGELTAALLRREDLLALISQEQPLLNCDSERMEGAEALVVYSKLLTKGHLVYFTKPLCSIRVSDVYTQPQQHEGREHIIKKREAVFNHIRNKAWYQEQSGPANSVRVALLSDPINFRRQNLNALQYKNLNLNSFDCWLDERTLKNFQTEYLIASAVNPDQATRIAVVINVDQEKAAHLTLTLASLEKQTLPILSLQPILVGEGFDNHTDLLCYPSTAEQRLSTLNHIINEHDHAWFIFIDAGDEFNASGLIALSANLPQAEGLLALYADEFFHIDGQPTGIAFRPDFNLDLLLSSPKTMAQHWLYRRELLQAAEGFDTQYPAAAEFDLILKLIESQGFNVVGHLSEPLLTGRLKSRELTEDAAIITRHLNNRGYPNAQIALDSFYNYRLRYQHPTTPTVSFVVLVNWHLPSLISCVTSLLEKTTYLNYELIIVADNHSSPERESWLEGISAVDETRIRVVKFDAVFHHAAMANLGASHARGDYLMFMHCELAVTDGEWLDNLLNHGQRAEVAVVGGKQLASNNKIRHAGYVLGVNGVAGECFRGQEDSQPSYLGRLQLDQNYTAVSGDFMLVRKAIYDELKGFDVELALFDDVDFCLRARQLGYLTVWTPYARILRPAARQSQFVGETVHNSNRLKQLEEDKIYARWMPVVSRDPAYNSNLSLRSRHFELNKESSLCWRPAQRPNVPVIMAHNADVAGCGYYRVIMPFEAMQREGLADGKVSISLLTHSELNQYKPDSLIIQRRYSPAFHQWIERVGKMSDVFKVFELDDYILNVPMKHYRRRDFTQEITAQLRKSLSFFDRFVVSTAPLAEALSSMHSDIRVMPNRLPVEWWGNLQSLRNQGRKPRVGWAGGASHTGDLEMIVDVVKEFANEVEWVFFGMCPMKLRPYIHELHIGVDISLYPEKLASLNLDLALAPVEDNIFNICKSNLRLMEYGACGIPVICSDVECYRDTPLPVTRVKNRFKDWCDAIRFHLNDLDYSEKNGLELQKILRRDWMLTGENLQDWVKAWTP